MEICCNEFHAYVGMESFSNTSDYCKYCFSTLFAKFSIKAFINGVSMEYIHTVVRHEKLFLKISG